MENNFEYISAAVTDKGLSEKRPQNEDSYLELKQRGLFAVADGVGGAQAGDVASQMAIEILGEAFVNMARNGDAEDVMKQGIEKANAAIFQMSHDLPQLSTMATTVVALHLQGNIATVGHVGDSRLYRLDGSGNLFRETQDHSIVEEEVRAGRMTVHQAAHHPSRNVISRALGAESTVEIDLKTIMFEPNASFLLCSDGITRHIEDHEIRALLISNEAPSDICGQMKKICYQRGAEDNLTAVIIKVSGQAAPQTFAADFEESTVAAARPAEFEQTIPQNFDLSEMDEAETRDLKIPDNFVPPVNSAVQPVHSGTFSEISISPEKEIEVPESVAIVQNDHSSPVRESQPETIETDEKTYRIDEKSGSGFFSKLFSSLLLMIAGAIIGVGIYYFTFAANVQPQTAQPAPVTTLQPQTDVITFKTFEENRRGVDRDPQQYLTTSAAPQDAEDYFLTGRANLLLGNFPQALKAFTEAKNRLAQAKETNSKTLANEIAISLAVINNPFAQDALKKDLAAGKSAANTQSNSVVNSNSADPANNGSSNSNR